ncbi:Uncharacterised protein [Serratia rubidaea]|uniref:Uncharacterized protein n=1 Tax=Serratia rubidaea TaxID=61652 RepID=A0A4U9HRE0_SERRU|nr:Uncharacterised protein [Serratia rubidaea]
MCIVMLITIILLFLISWFFMTVMQELKLSFG